MIQIEELIKKCDNSENTVKQLLQLYLDGYSHRVLEMQSFFENGDVKGLLDTSHELKGMFSNLCAAEVTELIRQLEVIVQAGGLPEYKLFHTLCSNIELTNHQIIDYLQ